MSKRIFWLVFIVFMSITAVQAQKSGDTAVTLLSPANETQVNDPNIVFSWMPVSGAQGYKLRVKSEGFHYKVDIAPTACTIDQCTFAPADDVNWQPHYGKTLKWSVLAKLEAGKAVSEGRLIHTEFLSTPTLIDPAAGTTTSSSLLTFRWANDVRVGEYALVFKVPKEGKIDPIKFAPAAICDDTQCTTSVDLMSFDGKARSGEYQWWVAATRDDVKGKSKSEKRTFSASLLPIIVALEPVNGLTVNTTRPLFFWTDTDSLDEYRIVVVAAEGAKVESEWTAANQLCEDGDCELRSLVLANGSYEWRVEGRVRTLDGRAKSQKMALMVYSPEATAEAMPLP